VPKRDRDGQGAGPEPRRDPIEIPNDLREEIVGIQLFDRGLQENAGPWQLRRACRKLAHGARTQLRPPPIRVKLLLGANGVFEVFVDIDRERADRRHGYTSSETSQALGAWTTVGWRVPCPGLGGNDEGPASMGSHGEDQDQWTVVKRRLAARSSANRPSCQGVC
jgi:hypothetical protein